MNKKEIFCLLIVLASLKFEYLSGQRFVEQKSISIINAVGDVVWGDYDRDGYLDILITGFAIGPGPMTRIYKNNGNNTFSEQTNITLEPLHYSNVDWGDYNGDGNLDFIITGYNAQIEDNGSVVTKVFKNLNGVNFVEDQNVSIAGINDGNVEFGDYDNDGDLDVLLAGSKNPGPYTGIFRNDGINGFSEQFVDILEDVISNNAVEWGDYNNDGFLDAIIAGSTEAPGMITKLYKNIFGSDFLEQTDIILPGLYASDVSCGDFDNDGDLDFFLEGYTNSGYISKIYKNQGNNNFEALEEILFEGMAGGCALWGDYDNDGDLDILLTGSNNTKRMTKIYANNGNGSFSEDSIESFVGISGQAAWGDYDNDGDLDIIQSGYDEQNDFFTKIYKNISIEKNITPNVISNLHEAIDGNSVTFSWDIAIDSNQSGGLTYNLYVYNLDSNNFICSGHAFEQSSIFNGRRLISQSGSINTNSQTLTLPNGHYKWSVQAIDACFKGGNFANERNFAIGELSIDKLDFNKSLDIFPNPVENYLSININVDLNYKIYLSDLSGKVVYVLTNCYGNKIIDLSLYCSGIYMLTIQYDRAILMKKIFKK